jgi:hypothetical protein
MFSPFEKRRACVFCIAGDFIGVFNHPFPEGENIFIEGLLKIL